MKVTILSRYGRAGASSRLRMFQYAAHLSALGLDSTPAPFFDDSYLAGRYEGRISLCSSARAYIRRIRQLRRAREGNLAWLEKEALPWLPWLIEQSLLPSGIPLVVDFDDAIFHQYDLHSSATVRLILGNKLDKLMASAALVTAGNRYLADRAIAAGASRVEIVPTVVDLTAYTPRPAPLPGASPRIGWIGSPSTWTEYVRPILPMLIGVAETTRARLLAVGAGRAAEAHQRLDIQPWTEDSEVSRIHEMDIGIMPLSDTPWARGKCGYKLIQYMACGLPVVASPIGVNAEIVEHGVNGFIATTEGQWRAALGTLLADAELRNRMGAAGRRKIEENYSLQSWGPRVARLLHSVVAKKRMQ